MITYFSTKYMPIVRYGKQIATISLDKIVSVESVFKLCKKRFRDNKIKILRYDKHLLREDDIDSLTKISTLYCYKNGEDIDDKLEVGEKKIQKKAPITNLAKRTYISPQLLASVDHLSRLKTVKNITVFPNAYNDCVIPKGVVVKATTVFPSTGFRLGRGSTIWGIKNICPKVKKLKSLQTHTYDGYAEIHRVVLCNSPKFKGYNYLLFVRSGDTDGSIKPIEEILKLDPLAQTLGSESGGEKMVLDHQEKMVLRNRSIRGRIADDILKKLAVDDAVLLVDQVENSIVKNEGMYIHRNSVVKPGLVFISSTRDDLSYLVKSDKDTPSGSGRRHGYYKTVEIAKNHTGKIVSAIRNNELVTEDHKFIYGRYPYGFKKIDHVMSDIADCVEIQVISQPIITYRR